MNKVPGTPWRMALSVGIVLAGIQAVPAKAQQPQGPPPVTVAKPLVKTVTEFDEYTGRFEAVERVELRARVSGLLTQQHFADGQTVKQGDLLFSIDPDLFQVAVDTAQAEVARTTAQLDFAREDYERAQALVRNGSVTARDIDQRQNTRRQAQASVNAASAALRQAELNLSYTRITAPIAGRMSAAAVTPGNFVQGAQGGGTVLTTIVTLDPIRFVFEASEANYLRYTRAAADGARPSGRATRHPVSVRLSDESTYQREGVLEFVDNEIRTGTGSIRARALLDNPGNNLTPGLFGRLRLAASAPAEAILVPDAAIVSDQNRRMVMAVMDDGTVAPKLVILGPLHDGLRIIRSGLSPTDRIIVSGLQRARPGSKVTPQETTIEAVQAQTR
jgi:membrane fusion protein, multidrug efflux system